MYDIVYSEKAEEDLAKLRRSEPAAFKKLPSNFGATFFSSIFYQPSSIFHQTSSIFHQTSDVCHPSL